MSSTIQLLPLETLSAAELIQKARENPPQPIIAGLLNVGDILLVHGPEESFKSVFVMQLAECMATQLPLFNAFAVAQARKVGIIETEIHETMLGERLAKMFPNVDPPPNLCFLSANTMKGWRRLDMRNKFDFVKKWIDQQRISILVVDIATDFFRGEDNPSDERDAGGFFDEVRNMGLQGCVLVRHNRKRRDGDQENHPNESIRGSAEWKEDPEAIVGLTRVDRRTNQVNLEVGKLRYGVKPNLIELWFDAGTFRLTALPPTVAVLVDGVKSRSQLVRDFRERFGIQDRLADTLIDAQAPYLTGGQRGHEQTWELNRARINEATWSKFLPEEFQRPGGG